MSNRDRAAEILHRHHDNCNDAAAAHAEKAAAPAQKEETNE